MPKSILGYAFAALLMVGLVAIVYTLTRASGGDPSKPPLHRYAVGEMEKMDFGLAGEVAPGTDFKGPDGAPISLSAYKGKTILVNFWATWCAPCEKEMPYLGALQRARGGPAFEVIAISVDALEDQDYARERLDELAGPGTLTFHMAPPENGYQVVYGTGTRGFPTTILYDENGREIGRLQGDADWSSLEAVALIDAALAR